MIIELSEYFAKDRYFSENAMQLRNIIDLINRSQLEENELKQIIETCNSKMKNSNNSINNSATSTNNSLPTWEEAKQILSTNEDFNTRYRKFQKRCYNENCKKYDEIVEKILSLLKINKLNAPSLFASYIPDFVNNSVINMIKNERMFKSGKNLIKIRSIIAIGEEIKKNLCSKNIDNSIIDQLKIYFKEILELYSSNSGDNNYELFDVKVNTIMDNKKMTRAYETNQVGMVKEFVFPGILFKPTNKIELQAVVRLG